MLLAEEEAKLLRKMKKDLRDAAKLLQPHEARYLVDYYYQMQKTRIQSSNRIFAAGGEPSTLIEWLFSEQKAVEALLKAAMGKYAESQAVGLWSLDVIGIGPIIAAGLLAHIDITKAPTAGHIWSYAGLDPNTIWHGRVKGKAIVESIIGKSKDVSDEEFLSICAAAGRKPSSLRKMAKDALTKTSLVKALSMRPFNAELKKLCWKIGESFVKTRCVQLLVP